MAAVDYQGIQSLPFEEEEDIQTTEEVPSLAGPYQDEGIVVEEDTGLGYPDQGEAMMAEDQESASVAAPAAGPATGTDAGIRCRCFYGGTL